MKKFKPHQKLVRWILDFVDAFNNQYFKWQKCNQMEYLWWYMPYHREFDNYYIFSLDEMYTAMYFDISKETLIERYNYNTVNGKINLAYYIRKKNWKYDNKFNADKWYKVNWY